MKNAKNIQALFLWVAIFIAMAQSAHSDSTNSKYPWLDELVLDTISTRFDPPDGFKRIPVEKDAFGSWIRGLPLLPGKPPVKLYNGEKKYNQSAHVAVLDMDIGKRDRFQCADAAMRLRAEYLRFAGRGNNICFKFTNGSKASWQKWSEGFRPKIDGNKVTWKKSSKAGTSYKNFKRYLEKVYAYAGTASLSKEMKRVEEPDTIAIGDLFIEGGFPGHAVIVVDVAQNSKGDRAFLLAQSYMPAQQIHILKNPANSKISPWYIYDPDAPLATPEWGFDKGTLKRFSKRGCNRN